MLKNVKTFLLASAALLMTFVATSSASTACLVFIYEPDIPESLKRDL